LRFGIATVRNVASVTSAKVPRAHDNRARSSIPGLGNFVQSIAGTVRGANGCFLAIRSAFQLSKSAIRRATRSWKSVGSDSWLPRAGAKIAGFAVGEHDPEALNMVGGRAYFREWIPPRHRHHASDVHAADPLGRGQPPTKGARCALSTSSTTPG